MKAGYDLVRNCAVSLMYVGDNLGVACDIRIFECHYNEKAKFTRELKYER